MRPYATGFFWSRSKSALFAIAAFETKVGIRALVTCVSTLEGVLQQHQILVHCANRGAQCHPVVQRDQAAPVGDG